ATRLDAVRQELEAEGWGWVVASPERDFEVIHSCVLIHPQPSEVPPELAEQREAIHQQLAELQQQVSEGGEDDDAIEQAYASDSRYAELEDQLTDIDGKIEALAAYDPDHVAIAGCYVSIAHNGSLCIEKGLVRKQDMKRLAKPDEAKEKKPKGLPATLISDLQSYRLQIAQVEMARNRVAAF